MTENYGEEEAGGTHDKQVKHILNTRREGCNWKLDHFNNSDSIQGFKSSFSFNWLKPEIGIIQDMWVRASVC